MPFARVTIDPGYDRNWIAKQLAFTTHTEELDAEGKWLFCADDVEAAVAFIDNYPAEYLAVALPEAKTKIEARSMEEFAKGFSPETGPLAGHTLQVRDMEDRTNWLASQVAYSAAIQQGAGDVAGATFRTADNTTVTCTYAEGAAALLAMQSWGASIMARAWELKDAALSAADIYDLAAVLGGIDEGWPTSVVEA